jgi:hypothetical protein
MKKIKQKEIENSLNQDRKDKKQLTDKHKDHLKYINKN